MQKSSTSESRLLLQDGTKDTSGLNVATATIVVVGGIFGTGIVTLPHCIAMSGILGIVTYVLLLIIAGYGGINLSKCWELVMELNPEYRTSCRNPYPVMAYICYGTLFGKVFTVLVNIINFSGALVMLILGCQMFQIVSNVIDFTICEWLVISGLCLTPFTWFGTPKHLWPMGVVSILTGLTCASLILYSLACDNIEMSTDQIPKTNLKNISFVFGVLFFTNSGTSMFPTIQNDMKKKKYFTHVVALSFLATACFLLPISFLTLKNVEFDVEPNIISSFKEGKLKTVAFLFLSLHTFLAVTILINPVYQDFEEFLGISRNFCLKRVLARSGLNLVFIFVAETIPKFDMVLNLVGGSLVSLFSFIFPAIFYMRLCQLFSRQRQGSTQWKIKSFEKVLLVFIIIFGIAAATVVTFNAIEVMVSEETFILPCYLRPFF